MESLVAAQQQSGAVPRPRLEGIVGIRPCGWLSCWIAGGRPGGWVLRLMTCSEAVQLSSREGGAVCGPGLMVGGGTWDGFEEIERKEGTDRRR